MDSNHSNLYNKLLALVQGICGVLHVEVNGTGERVGEGNGNVSGTDWRGLEGTGETGEGRGRHEQERASGEGVGGG